ncbi:hypothetical protein VIGAN_04135700 [Vigna angularis var. angularis]|uniref:Uncharacterized protein n=1 Tax=Vigna angularis var. angularis TaxID=157739 RepID=A0A0S3RTZ0_PHAAN|nr:hypothetical protein VIGAN_04135700 [Vigna angularis var. angularis]
MAQTPRNALRELRVLNRAVKSVRELSLSSTKPRERSPRAPSPKPSGHKYSTIQSQTTAHCSVIQKGTQMIRDLIHPVGRESNNIEPQKRQIQDS